MRLSRRSEPFDSDDYIFELKIDAFRSPMSKAGLCHLVTRTGRAGWEQFSSLTGVNP